VNILFLAPRLPLPADTGGKIRTLNILKQLAKEHTVHLACFSFEADDPKFSEDLKSLGVAVTLVPMKESTMIQKAIGLYFYAIPFSLAKYNTQQMDRAVKDLLKEQSFDAVHVDHLHMAHYIKHFPKIPRMLDEHNVEYKILERCSEVETSPLKKHAYHDQAVKMWAFEAEMAERFQCVFACSEDDRLLINKMTSGLVPIHVVPNGVDTEFFQPQNKDVQLEDALVFTGSMDWLPNDDAITYFCRDILPLIWQGKKDVKLYVVGKNPSAAVLELAAKDNRVVITGRVDDVRPYIERSKVFIVPLRIGGGTRLKILEAMSMTKAVVSTTIGAEGIQHTRDVDIALADHPQQFAQTIIELIDNPQRVADLGKEGRKLVCAKYDWNVVGEKLNGIYEKAIHELSK
jgi:sugar transferase (PEP-CTERM/EpsH1 system associated)